VPGSPDGIGTYYDRLGRWTRALRPLGYGGGSDHLTVHRFLADPRQGGRPSPTRIHDIILERLTPALPARPRLLDAGCGLGGTLLALVGRLDGSGIGLTLSPSQQRRAEAAARAQGIGDRVTVRVQSYDTPPPGPFDLIVAIESLAHSPSPEATLTALAAVLAPGGCLAIVDDMPEPGGSDAGALQRFKVGWQAPVLWGRDDYERQLRALGMTLIVDEDLTPAMHVRSAPQIRRLEAWNRVLYRLIPNAGLRGVLDSYDGGLALERLYAAGAMTYRLMVGRGR
jgi:SAM-dependent methyltransferase